MKINTNIKEVQDKLKKIEQEINRQFDIQKLAEGFAQNAKQNTNRFKNRTGNLKNSIQLTGGGNSYTIGTDVPYGRIQDVGGTITPVKAKFLCIPTRKGLGSPRSINDLFKPRGHDVLMNKSGEVLFILKKSVRLKATNWWSDAIDNLKKNMGIMLGKIEVIVKNA